MSLDDTGVRHITEYRKKPMYIFTGEKSLSISMLLEEGVDKETVSGAIWECSRRSGSLGDSLSMVLIK